MVENPSSKPRGLRFQKPTPIEHFYEFSCRAPLVATGFAWVRKEKTYVITSGHVREKVKNPVKLYADFPVPVRAHRARVLSMDHTDDTAVLVTDV
jgi:hypothetical protein